MWRFFLLLLFSISAAAQPYGQFKYTHAGAFMTSAFKTSINSQGHLLVGYKPNSASGTYNFCIDKTNPSGGFTSGAFSFKKEYQYLNSAACGSVNVNQILNCAGVSVIETNIPGSPKVWYALTGSYDEGCFFATLDSLGRPISYKAYMFPYINPMSGTKTYIAESISSPGNYFITGTHDSTVFVLKVNTTGNVIWSSYYHIGTSYFSSCSLMECPFTGNLIVFGSTNPPLPWNTGTDGFVLSLNKNNGNVNFYKTYTIPIGACQLFQAARPAFSTTGGQGYIIGGSTDAYPALPWMIKIGTAGNIIWTTVIKSSTDPGASTVVDVIERPISSTYEYYGVLRSLYAGMIIVRLDDYGIPVQTVNNEYVFNTSATVAAIPCNLDFENSGPNIALTTYGTVDQTNGGELYMVRSYFNGKSGCNEASAILSNYYVGPDTVINPWIMKYGSLSACNMFSLVDIPVNPPPVVLCSNVIVSGGSNSGVTVIRNFSEKDQQVTLFPNPAESSTTFIFNLNSRSKVKISIYNSTGQYLNTVLDSELENGSYSSEINFQNMRSDNGLYFVRFTLNGETKSYKVIYNK